MLPQFSVCKRLQKMGVATSFQKCGGQRPLPLKRSIPPVAEPMSQQSLFDIGTLHPFSKGKKKKEKKIR